jgi:iron complex outermembrane recepter protein
MPSRRPRGRLLLALAFALPIVKADDPQSTPPNQPPSALKRLTLEQLSQIEVTSPSKEPTPVFHTPVAIYVLTGDDIRRAGVTTIPDALRLVPGVEVAQIDGSKWSVGIRGFGTRLSRDVLVLIDGREVYTPLLAGTYWEVQDTLLEDIDRIEVIRGPGGTIWGPNAVNGVINIITKSAKETHGTFAEAGGGSVEQGFLNYRYGGESTLDDLNYRVYAKAYDRGPEHHSDGDDFDAWRGAQSGFRMDWGTGNDAYTFSGDGYLQEDGERVNLSTYTPPLNETIDGYANVSGANGVFRWKRTLGDGSDIQVQAYYDRTNRREPNLGEARDTVDVDYLERAKVSDRQELLFGAEARASDGRFSEIASGLVFYPFHRLDYLLSGFFEDDFTLVENKLFLNAGSKILSTNYTGVAFQPSVRLMWTPTDQQTFWASFTHAVRTPSDAEEDFYLSSYLGMTAGLPVFARFNGNPLFAPEKLNAWEAGYRELIRKNLFLDISTFYNRYHDVFSEDLSGGYRLETALPFPTPLPPPLHLLLPAEFGNDLYGPTLGGEIAPEWRPSDRWRLRGSYSYLSMDLRQAPGLLLGAGPQMVVESSPKHEVSLDSAFDVSRNLQIDLIYRFVSALPAEHAPAYSTGDVHITWRFRPHLEFSLVGRNLFQPYHVEYGADPGDPVAIVRSAYASIAWRSQ